MSVAALPGLRVVLVEDDADHAELIAYAIRSFDERTEVIVSADGEAGLDLLRACALPPDLVLLDINLPGISGFEVLAELKRDPRLRCVPVVMLTSSDLPDDVARSYALGASGFICKPSYLHDLRAMLGHTLLYWTVMRRVSFEEVVA